MSRTPARGRRRLYGDRVAGADDDLAQHWRDIASAAARLQRLVDHDIEVAGMPAQWFAVLDLLAAAPEHRLPMSTLAREVTMTSGGFSKLADRMALEGLIDRRSTSDDRRVVHATLTTDGLRLARRIRAEYRQALQRRLLSVVSAEELAAAAATLNALVAAQDVPSQDRDAPLTPELVASERDPALPDRRGRGRKEQSPGDAIGPPPDASDAD